MALEAVVLAAGEGKRMRSRLAKVLHPLAGKPLLGHVLDVAESLNPRRVHVVVGERGEEVKAHFQGRSGISWVSQAPRLGTGHAVAQALPAIADDATVLVLLGDAPLIDEETLAACVRHAASGIALVTAKQPCPDGFGRVLRADGKVVGIVEEKDASAEEKAIREINAGLLAAPKALLAELLANVSPANAQGEYYLTDVIALAAGRGCDIESFPVPAPDLALGVNDRAQLARLERYCQRQQAEALMAAGVTLMDPDRLDIRGKVTAGLDCTIDVNVIFEGEVVLGDNVTIGPGCVIRDAKIGDDVEIRAMTSIDGATLGAGCRVGPYARLRPGTELAADVHIGNFVETKKAQIGAGAKANHLAYLGDATVGGESNIGAGAITCNYDGVEKHRTEIGTGVFVGTNATLVAPLVIEDDAYVGAGSTITKTVGREDLAIGRGRQRNVQGWTPPAKRSPK